MVALRKFVIIGPFSFPQKLEETAAENSRLEHEMMMLRQKIQQTMARNARRDCGDGTSKTRHIESEMIRVQALLEDLQNRRMHLSQQVSSTPARAHLRFNSLCRLLASVVQEENPFKQSFNFERM